MKITAYFYSAMDARLALSALRAIGAEPSDPIPVDPPQGGRPWLLSIRFAAAGAPSHCLQAEVPDEVSQTVMRWNGTLARR